MNKLKNLIEEMTIEDLNLIKKDIISGNLNKLIDKKINSTYSKKICPVCNEKIENNPIILEFGKNLRIKAYFDATDCLSYFAQTKLRHK